MRTFIALEFPENVRAEIFHAFEGLKKSGSCYGNFVEKENLHMTLSFLGEISEEKSEAIKKILSEIDFQKFPIEIGKVGFFPNEHHIKVIWLEVVSSEIANLKKEIEMQLSKEGFSFTDSEFIPHLTVARIKGIKAKSKFFEEIEKIKVPKIFFIAEDFAFMKSILKGKSPEYKVIEKYGMRIRG